MSEQLHPWDYAAVGGYFALVLGVGIWASLRRGKDSAEGYFLAGKHMTWLPVGASLFASNVGAPMFIGLAGAGAASGYSVVLYEWTATFLLIALGWFFVPIFVASGAYTMPEYLMKRFGGVRLRICLSILGLFLYILTKISAEIFCGALFMQLLLGWNLYICIISLLAVTAVYTVIGGLVAVMYTDTLQTGIILIGACILTFRSFQEIHGFDGLEEGFVTAVSNITKANVTHYSCGLPPKDSLHIWRDPVHGDIPWPGAVFGLLIIATWVWCTDQLMVQRTLAAKNISHAKGGSLFAGALKILPFFLWIIPGMISRILYPDEIACSSPERCYEVCQNKAGCTNVAYPILVLRLLPQGLRGLMLAALLAALMSSLTSIFNSASSMFTIDIWPRIRKKPSENELMIVGRVAVLACTVIGILWLPILQQAQGGQLWGYLQSVTAYIAPPWTTLFMFALLWKRTSEQGAFWGLIAGLVVGIIRMVVDFTYPAPYCGSGEEDTRPGVLKHVHFLYFAMISAVVTTVTIVLVSLCTEPRSEAQLGRTTWWTHHHADPDLEIEDDKDDVDREMGEEIGEEKADEKIAVEAEVCPFDVNVQSHNHNRKGRNEAICKSIAMWMCGMTQRKSLTLSRRERIAIKKRFTSLEEHETASKALNACAIGLSLITFFLLGYFS
ncbi:sodium/glucose cotransporter 4-like [Haliotis rufescens]|uniref:sodium/glucose cotransporter 4-like n=1 Tax=Haliotis rufescens TaxID=6454 RepID=UPI00201EE245|nr:sodium/glucose cotransporter 4-like [Haliotis rufescens]